MPEHDCLPPDLAAAEFVTHMARISGLPRTAARERASEALRHVGLYEERYRQIGGYSTGMKQRVKLAQALVHDPDLLLLDEPTNGLDPAGRDAMLALIHRIGTEFGISVVVCSHLLGEVERICDSLVAIDGGRLLRADRIAAMTAGHATCSSSRSPRAPTSWPPGCAALGLPVQPGGPAAAGAARRRRRPTTRSSARSPIWTCRCTARPAPAPGRRALRQPRRAAAHVIESDRRVIHDIGYQRYTGAAAGPRATLSARSTCTALRTAFGLGRSAKAKIFPWVVVGLVIVMAAIVAAIQSAIRAQIGPGRCIDVLAVPDHDVSLLVILFCAVVAPELVSRDLRGGVLPLYFSRPLTRSRLRAGQAGGAGHARSSCCWPAPHAADVPRRRVHRWTACRAVWDEFVLLRRAGRRRRCARCVFASIALLVASLGRPAGGRGRR